MIDTITEQLETLKSEVTALKTQLGTQFKYIGDFLCIGNNDSKPNPKETIIELDSFGLYLVFATQGGAWKEGSMIFIDYTSAPSDSTIVYLPENEKFSIAVGTDAATKQLIFSNNDIANLEVFVYKVGERKF